MNIREIVRHISYGLEIYLAFMVFCHHLPKKKGFWWKTIIYLIVLFSVSFFIIDSVNVLGIYIPVSYLVTLGVECAGIFFTQDIKPNAALFVALCSILMQHMASTIDAFLSFHVVSKFEEVTLEIFSFPYGKSWFLTLLSPIVYTAVYLVFLLLIVPKTISKDKIEIKPKKAFIPAFLIILFVFVIQVNAIEYGNSNTAVYQLLDIVVCIITFFYLFFSNSAEIEEKAMMVALEKQREHYELLVNGIDSVNRKYHDLKYELAALKGMQCNEERSEHIDKMSNELSNYEKIGITGNVALDSVLHERILSCEKSKIKIYYELNGKMLDFIDPPDIYIIFGNLVDNAIEAVAGYDDSKKIINVKGKKIGSIIIVALENYCERELNMKSSLPSTSKRDQTNHGIGLKSVTATLKKYNGKLVFNQTGNIVTVTVSIPEQIKE